RDRAVSQRACVEDDRSARRSGFLNPGYKVALAVRLLEDERETFARASGRERVANVFKGLAPVDFGFARAKQIEIGAVENVDGLHHHTKGLSASRGGLS